MLRWGIVGTGHIASRFASDMSFNKESQISMVGSRDHNSANEFCAKHSLHCEFGSYFDVFNSKTVDVVYIATPHSFHYPLCIEALNAGKSVLCEKPLALNHIQALELYTLAQYKGLLLQEALWMAFLPAFHLFKKEYFLQPQNPLHWKTSFHFEAPFYEGSRLWDQSLGGGALLDIGIYGLALMVLLGKKPFLLQHTSWQKSHTGVDLQSTSKWMDGNQTVWEHEQSLLLPYTSQASAKDEQGILYTLPHFYGLQEWSLGQHKTSSPFPAGSNGLQYQVAEIEQKLLHSKETPTSWTDTHSVQVHQLMDCLRHKWGLVYPQEHRD